VQGLRLLEALQLRVNDIDLERREELSIHWTGLQDGSIDGHVLRSASVEARANVVFTLPQELGRKTAMAP
jgi:integrase